MGQRSFTSMSTLPLKLAPSAMRMRGALMSPTTRQSVLSSTLSVAAMLPGDPAGDLDVLGLDVGLDHARALDEQALLAA